MRPREELRMIPRIWPWQRLKGVKTGEEVLFCFVRMGRASFESQEFCYRCTKFEVLGKYPGRDLR